MSDVAPPVPGVSRANLGNKRGRGRAICSVDDCDDIVKGRRLCQKHYMRARRHNGDVTAGEGRYGNGWETGGYISTTKTGHVLARAKGHVQVHRLVLFDQIGYGPHRCHWCKSFINWAYHVGPGVLVVDHLDDDGTNNSPSNLVASCQPCNAWRGTHPETFPYGGAG